MSRSSLIAVLSIAAAISAALVVSAAEPKPLVVSLPEKATFTDTVRSIHIQTGRVILAEVPQVPRNLTTQISEIPLDNTLTTVAKTFHVHTSVRPKSIILVRAYGDPREEPTFEPELMADITKDVYRLIHGFAPVNISVQGVRNENEFAKSFDRDQLHLLRGEGLPASALRPEQTTLWDIINKTRGYSNLHMVGRRVALLFSTFKQGVVAYRQLAKQVEGGQIEHPTELWYEYPDADPENDHGTARFELQLAVDPPQAEGTQTLFDSVTPGDPNHSQPSTFNKAFQGPDGETTVEEIARAVQNSTGINLEILPYARRRKLLLFADNASTSDVVTSLMDLYGWVLVSVNKGRYRLNRPTLPPARDAIDLHTKIRSAIPPTVYVMWRDKKRVAGSMPARYYRELTAVLRAATAIKGKGWNEIGVAELPASEQLRLANLLFERYLLLYLESFASTDRPRGWLAYPELGVFRLRPTGDQHPLLEFKVDAPDGKSDGWGYYLGTSTLQD